MTVVLRMTGLALLLSTGLGACAFLEKPQPGAQPQTTASTVAAQPYGPSQPSSGFNDQGVVPIAGNSGVFGTDDEIAISDGTFADNTYSPDPLLDDSGEGDLAGLGADYSGDAALLAGVSLPGDDGSTSYFDSDVGPVVYFATDSSELSEEARETLRRQGAWLQLHPAVSATIEGHADERGTRQYNLALGERRASAVRGYLLALGIDPGRLRKVSYGDEQPVDPGSGPEAWARNRRAVTVPGTGGALASSGAAADIAAPLPVFSAGEENLYADDPLLDPSLDALLGTDPGAGSLSGDIPDNPVLERIESGS